MEQSKQQNSKSAGGLRFAGIVVAASFLAAAFVFPRAAYAVEINVIYSGETHAALSPADSGGGLAERAAALGAFPRETRLLIDGGGFAGGGIYDTYSAGRAADSVRTLKTLAAMGLMGYDAVGIGDDDLIYGGSGGGVTWPDGERVAMPYTASGAYLFLDAAYAELFAGYSAGSGKWESPNTLDPQDFPNMPRSYINIGAFAKYPLAVYERVKLFPLLGLEYEASISGNIKYDAGTEYALDGADGRPAANSLSALWFKIGAGIDFDMGNTLYLRSELIYGARAANEFEKFSADKQHSGAWAELGQGVAFKVGVGVRL